jgi:uncharacterized protein
MQLDHSFVVPRQADSVFASLLDLELVAGCMPGAALTSIEGDTFEGTLKLKLGPIVMTYQGRAEIVEKDPIGRRVVLAANGRDARGNGTAAARIVASLETMGPSTTRVLVDSDLDITGKPAQFGRGIIKDVGDKLIGQFATALAERLTADVGLAVARDAPKPDLGDVGPQPISLISLAPLAFRRVLPAVAALSVTVWLVARGVRRRR